MLVDHRVMRRRDTIARICSYLYPRLQNWLLQETCLCQND